MKKLGIILFGLALLAQPVQAQPWTPDLAPWIANGSTVQYKFSGVAPIATYGWGYSAGPYQAAFLSPTAPNVTIYCADFYTLVANGGRTITATAFALTDPPNASFVQRWGSPTTTMAVPMVNFQKAAFLASLYPTYAGSPADIKAIAGAIWALTSNPVSHGVPSDPGVLEKLALAEAGWGSYGRYGEWRLLVTTDVSGDGNGARGSQHFLVQTQTVTPEPQTYVLLGSGLLFLVFVGRRRLKENGYS